MECIKDIEKLKGKKIKDARYVDFGECMALIFDDETYTIIDVEFKYDQKEIGLACNVEDYVKKQAGILSGKEYNEIQKQKEDAQKANTEKQERRLLEDLQRKYQK